MANLQATEATAFLPTQQHQQRQQQREHWRAGNSFVSRLHRHSKVLLVAGVVLVATALSLSVSPPAATDAPLVPPTTIQASASFASTAKMYPAKDDGTRDMLQFCEERYIAQELDHFRANGGGGTYQQRYFVCAKENFDPKTGAIFFYVGNEADVTLYLNNTGLMWENAKDFDALIVFAEHRYFGKSLPFGDDVLDHMEFLSVAQALADYAVLVQELKETLDTDVPVIGFGGSYGGMLCTWFRLKYPHIVDGVIAASAPILAFMGDRRHPVDTEGFQRGVTFDMSEQAGSAPNCIPNVRRAFTSILELGKTDAGRQELVTLLKVCDSNTLDSEKDVSVIVDAVLDAYGNLAMGNYPYPTSYITSGESFLPAYPMRAACEYMKDDYAQNDTTGLLLAFRESFGVFLNSTKTEKCFFPAASPSNSKANVEIDAKGNFYSYIECAELYAPFSRDNVHDVFPAAPVNLVADDAACFEQWGVRIRLDWAVTEFGGLKALESASNIVLSNGKYDPWAMIGISQGVSDSVVYLPIDGSTHHLDLFFTHPLDPPSVTQARKTELEHIRKWIKEFYADKKQ